MVMVMLLELVMLLTSMLVSDAPLRVHLGRRDAPVLLSEFDDLVDVVGGPHLNLGHARQDDLRTLSANVQTRQFAAQQVVYRLVVDLHHRRLQYIPNIKQTAP